MTGAHTHGADLFPDPVGHFGFCKQFGFADGAALQAVLLCWRCCSAGGAALQVLWLCRQCGSASSTALQAVRLSKRAAFQVSGFPSEWLSKCAAFQVSGFIGGAALQALQLCRQCGFTGGAALQTVQENGTN